MNIKLCLESTEIIDLGVVDWVNGEPSNIAEGKADVARELRTVKVVHLEKGYWMPFLYSMYLTR